MFRRKLWIFTSILMVLVTVLASCGDNTPTTTTPGTTTTVPGTTTPGTTPGTTTPGTTTPGTTTPAADPSKTPIYGGTAVFSAGASPTRWDPGELAHLAGHTMVQGLISGDWTKGPQGTKEFPWDQQTIPESFLVPYLSESIEITGKFTVVHHLRKGITYNSNNDAVPGVGREMVADDFVKALVRTQAMPKSIIYRATGEADKNYVKARAIDKYTLEITNPTPILNISTGSANALAYPPEAVQKFGNLEDWRNNVGTGPFLVTDFVPDSSISYARNPTYWEVDPLRPQYKMPYVDAMRSIVIVDPATQMAAAQTGKVLTYGTTRDRGEFLIKNSKQLKYLTRPENYNVVVFLNLKNPLFQNLQVRRALAIAIDRKSILKDFMQGQGALFAWPLWSSVGNDVFTPLDQMPADVQELYDFNPTKAKQMLATEGYPAGFKVELLSPQVEAYVDRANIVKTYWDAIGVQTTVNVIESGTFYDRLYGKAYPDAAIVAWGNSSEVSALGWAWRTGILYNYGGVSDPKIDEAYTASQNETDSVKRRAIYKAIYPYGAQQAWEIALPQMVTYVFYQPYMHGYAGEYAAISHHIWIDPVLKAQMGH